jgi:Immunity protein Imm1
MTKWTLSWGSDHENGYAVVTSVQELDRQLDQLEQRARVLQPMIVELCDAEDPVGPILSIGVGADRSVATWTVSEEGDGNLVSNQPRPAGDSVWFEFLGEPTEYAPRKLITPAAAREAARRFVETSERPSNIEWDAV